MKMVKKPSAFIDRDGTINFDGGYINHPENFHVFPFAAQAIRMLNMADFLSIVVTNQSGIGRGFYTEEMMHTLNAKMTKELNDQGAKIDGIYYCPHDINSKIEKYRVDCDCRKPFPGMINQAISEHPVDTSCMYFIGDKYSDMQAGWAAGCKSIFVNTGYGRGNLETKSKKWEKQPDYCAENLLEAINFILKDSGRN